MQMLDDVFGNLNYQVNMHALTHVIYLFDK